MPPRRFSWVAAIVLAAAPGRAQVKVPKVELEETPEEPEPGPKPEPEAEAEAEEPAAAEEPEAEGDAPAVDLEETPPPEREAEATAAPASEVIADPELEGAGTGAAAGPVVELPGAGPTTWRTVLHTRWGADVQRRWPSEDVFEGTTIALVEVEQRRSESVELALGMRVRHGFAMREQGGNARYELDVAPTAASATVTLAEGLHLRAGYQVISTGRFDVFSGTNFLAVVDLRSGPGTMPDALHVAQPALRLDVDRWSGFTLQAYYVPFFQPHVVNVHGGDYALLTPYDRYVDAQLETNPLPPPGGPEPSEEQVTVATYAATRGLLERALGRSGVTYGARHGFVALGPAPSLSSPQGALRATFHGTAGEIAATVGTALERVPAIVLGPRLAAALDPDDGVEPTQAELDAEAQAGDAIRAEHGRFFVAGIDGATDAGPLQLGAEVVYTHDRTLIATAPLRPSRPTPVDVLQLGLRADFVEGTTWVVAAETFVAKALQDPLLPGLGWFGFEESGIAWGAGVGVQWLPAELLKLELGAVLSTGPTFVTVPRVEWQAFERVYLELGAVVVEGPTPALGSATASVGGYFDDVDQVFVGLRWMP